MSFLNALRHLLEQNPVSDLLRKEHLYVAPCP